MLRFPDRKIRFINAGWGGDTAAGGLKRLDRDVFVHKPTVVTVAYGVNDIGWGTRANDEHKQKYLDGIRGIVTACKDRGVRVYICSAAITAEDPEKAENGFLQKMCDEGMALSRSLGGNAIDVQRAMRAIQRKIIAANKQVSDKTKQESLHTTDGVHLNDLGQLAMAFAILKGLGAPADVSSAGLDASESKVLWAKDCTITNVKKLDDGITFQRLDKGLPFNYDIFYGLNYRFVPVPQELNRYQLTIKNLPKGRYEITADGRSAGSFTAEQLNAGVNIASSTPDVWQPGGPWDAQANLLRHLTNARHEVGVANVHGRIYLPHSPAVQPLDKQAGNFDEQIVAMQRTIARPQPYTFVVRPQPSAEKKAP